MTVYRKCNPMRSVSCLAAAGLAPFLVACSIQPQVTVEKPIVNVDLCLAFGAGEVELVACEAGARPPIKDSGASAPNDAEPEQ